MNFSKWNGTLIVRYQPHNYVMLEYKTENKIFLFYDNYIKIKKKISDLRRHAKLILKTYVLKLKNNQR